MNAALVVGPKRVVSQVGCSCGELLLRPIREEVAAADADYAS
jgi:hypothetical protein